MSISFPASPSWLARLKVPTLLFGLWLLVYGCNRGVDAWQAAAQRRRAAPHLEAANPLRHRLGLVPIGPNFKPPFYEEATRTSAERVVYFGAEPESTGLLQRGTSKYITLDASTGDPLTEVDFLSFVGPKTWESKALHNYELKCAYSFERAKQRQEPWKIQLTDEYYDGKETTTNPVKTLALTRTQADSVLRSWRLLSRQDSLARLTRLTK